MQSFLLIAIAALGTSAEWHALQFRSIPQIQSLMKDGKITLEVKSSAGGLVRRLPRDTRVKSLLVTGSVKGEKVDAGRLWEKGLRTPTCAWGWMISPMTTARP